MSADIVIVLKALTIDHPDTKVILCQPCQGEDSMPKITIRVERSENDFYTSSNVKVCQVPTIGELVDLASLVGVKSRLGHVPVERVHPLSKWRVASHPVIVLKESEISPEVLSKISARWTHYEATYCRRER